VLRNFALSANQRYIAKQLFAQRFAGWESERAKAVAKPPSAAAKKPAESMPSRFRLTKLRRELKADAASLIKGRQPVTAE
jgi:hypothetical protein